MKDWIWPIIIAVIALAILRKHPELLGKLKGSSKKLGFSDPKILIAIGLVVFNLISWAMIPWWWEILTYKWYVFVFFNVGFWTVLYLRTVKIKNAAGEDTKESNPTASKLASIVSLVLVAGLITTTVYKIRQGDLTKEEYENKVAVERALAKEPVLAVVAKCRPPKEFDSLEKVQKANKLYEEKGIEPWLSSSKCLANQIPKGTIFTLAVREKTENEWSKPVFSLTMRDYLVSADSEQEYKTRINGNDEMIAKGDRVDKTIYSMEFKSKGTVTVVMKPVQSN